MLKQVLQVSLRAPSSFNLQPWRFVVASKEETKRAIANCMPGANAKRVLEAPASVVLLADKEAVRTLHRLEALERAAGQKPAAYIDGLGEKIAVLVGGALGP